MQSCKPHAPQASPPPAVNTPRSNLMHPTVEGLLGDIAVVGGVADDAETDMAEAETAAEVACQLSAHLTSASAAPPVAATPASAVPPDARGFGPSSAGGNSEQGEPRGSCLGTRGRAGNPPEDRPGARAN